MIESFRKSALDNKENVTFSFSDVKSGIQERLAQTVELVSSDLPKLMVCKVSTHSIDRYIYKGDLAQISKDKIDQFVSQFKAGAIEKYIKSDEIPEKNDQPLKIIVAKNFNDIVGKDKDVLLYFYSPKCGICSILEPKYTELANDMKDSKDLVIAKCDGTTNEIEDLSVTAFPTIKFFRKGSSEPLDYTGLKEVQALKDYLKEQG